MMKKLAAGAKRVKMHLRIPLALIISTFEEAVIMAEYQFDAAAVRDRMVEEIKKLASQQGFSKVVIGISGGKDSTVTAALCARALGKENVYGVMLPDGEQKDISDSIRVCEALGIRQRTINIGPMHEALRAATDQHGLTAKDHEFSVPCHGVSSPAAERRGENGREYLFRSGQHPRVRTHGLVRLLHEQSGKQYAGHADP